MGPSSGRVEAVREEEEALTACSSGLLSWVLRVAVALGAVVVVCLVTGRRNVAESVTCGFESDD